MKKAFLSFSLLFVIALTNYAQADIRPSTFQLGQNQKTVPYRIFQTQSAKVCIKLDTRTGQMWQIHFGQDNSQRFINNLNEQPLVKNTLDGNDRFTLIPTQLFFTFILLDHITGKTWQVDWSDDPQIRNVNPIQ
ncbi:hypothetical protein [Sediminibacterium salmoneum]|uniref:hypothetical protein n=1 Tax=Sediminibacterium salmoneum TaxID=426421 RepID=UPI000684FA0A|nr:hypothetical protein [Sediminibacterium salmoneum]